LSRPDSIEGTGHIPVIMLAVASIVFASVRASLLLERTLLPPIVLAAAAFSSLIYILLWDGACEDLANKGALGILIDAAIFAATVVGYRYL
jgi:hypothetical protein